MEPIPGDRSHSWVTYVWKGDSRTRGVSVVAPQVGWGELGMLDRVPRTRVWFRTFKTRNDCFGGYRFVPNPPPVPAEDSSGLGWIRLMRMAKLDPLNPITWHRAADPEHPTNPLFGTTTSILELPKAPHHRELEERPGVPRGKLILHRLKSRYLRNTRRIWTYSFPGETRTSRPRPMVIFFDGFGYTGAFPVRTVLDNMIDGRQIPPVSAVLVDSLDLEVRARELTGYAPFGRFLVRELLPWVRKELGFSPRPRETVLAGISYGGLAAMYWALRRPDLFRNVISQTGAFSWSPVGVDEPGWLTREFMRRPRLPLRIYMDVGRYEARSGPENELGHLAANRHLRDVLRMKKYPLFYQEFCGAHDLYCCRQTLVDALRWTLGNRRASGA